MPTLDEFKEKQKKAELKRKESGFKPKRYAPYLLHEEIVKISEKKENIVFLNSDEEQNVESKNSLKKQDRSTEELVAGFYGIKRKIIFYFLELCNDRGDLTTGPVTAESLVKVSSSTYKTIKRILQNMIEDGLIKRKNGKRGRGGFSIFTLSTELKETMLKYKKIAEYVKKDFKDIAINNVHKENINNLPIENSKPLDFLAVDIDPLLQIGFTKQHLEQISSMGKLPLEIIQDSIFHFGFDLKHNKKALAIKGDPLNYFMGIVSKRPYTAPSNYIDPILEAMNAYHKTKEQSEKQKAEIEQKVQEIEFRTWHDNLTDSEILELLPDEIRNDTSGIPSFKQTMKTQFLKKYYRETLWPERRRELCTSTTNWTTIDPLAP